MFLVVVRSPILHLLPLSRRGLTAGLDLLSLWWFWVEEITPVLTVEPAIVAVGTQGWPTVLVCPTVAVIVLS